MGRRALLLVNRKSRSGASDIEAARARLVTAGIEVVEPDLDSAAEIPRLIRSHRDTVDMVVIGGGDGSMNLAAPALVETGLPLGLIPLGTANDLARTLSIPTDAPLACTVVCEGRRHRIDLGRVNGRYFFNVAHIGLGAQITRALLPVTKQRWGGLAYVATLVRMLRSMQAFHADIVCDGEQHRLRAIQLSVGNGRHFGGGTIVAAPARIDDGCFFVCSVKPLGWRQMLAALVRMPALRAGRFEMRDPVHVLQGRTIDVRTRLPMPVSADGEIVARTPAHFEMAAAAIEVFVPAAYFVDREQVEECHVAQG